MNSMNSNVGNQGVIWTILGGEMLNVVYELRYMMLLSAILILSDLWWGHSEAMKRYAKAEMNDDKVCMEKYRWRKSRAIRRTANKAVDYITYMLCGAFIGLAITEPICFCNHTYAAIFGLLLGCMAEVASIIGHCAYVKYDVEFKLIDIWRLVVKVCVKFIKLWNKNIGKALEEVEQETK